MDDPHDPVETRASHGVTDQASLRDKWTLGAIRSFLDRLVEKELVCVLDDDPIYRFEAIHDRETLLREKSREFLEKYFSGSLRDFVTFHLENNRVTSRKAEELIKSIRNSVKRK